MPWFYYFWMARRAAEQGLFWPVCKCPPYAALMKREREAFAIQKNADNCISPPSIALLDCGVAFLDILAVCIIIISSFVICVCIFVHYFPVWLNHSVSSFRAVESGAEPTGPDTSFLLTPRKLKAGKMEKCQKSASAFERQFFCFFFCLEVRS